MQKSSARAKFIIQAKKPTASDSTFTKWNLSSSKLNVWIDYFFPACFLHLSGFSFAPRWHLLWCCRDAVPRPSVISRRLLLFSGSPTTWCPAPRVPTPQGSPTRPSSTRRSNTNLCMKRTSCTCESCKCKCKKKTQQPKPLSVHLAYHPLLPAVLWDDILLGICLLHHYSKLLLKKKHTLSEPHPLDVCR